MSARRGSSALVPLAWIATIAVALWLAVRHGFANYDTFYALVWGDEIAQGESPDLDVLLPPTPHPLATFAGIVLSPLGDGAEDAVVAIAFLSLGAIGYLTYRLGSEWFNRPVGLLAAAIVLTRVPMLDFGVRAYVDIPYIALVLAALLVETKHRGLPPPARQVTQSSSFLAFSGTKKPARTGGGHGLCAPRTAFQMISLNKRSSSVSSFERSCFSIHKAPTPPGLFFSVRSTFGTSCV